MTYASDWSRPDIPVPYVRVLLEILDERGIARDAALRETGIPRRVLSEADGRVTPLQWGALAHNALQLFGDNGLGYELGLRLRPSAHGFLGFAAMTGRDLREAIRSMAKYLRTRARNVHISFAEEGDRAMLQVREQVRVPFENVRNLGIEVILLGIARMVEAVTEKRASDLELCFDWPEPPYHARYRDRIPLVRFGCPTNQFRFPVAILDLPLVLADECAHQQALAQVAIEHASVRAQEGDIAARVRAELQLSVEDGYPDRRKVAAKLAMSTRTLTRKLSAQRTSYQALLEEACQRDARHLLETSSLDMQAISVRLGFDNAANFTRAFKRWTGLTPRDLRLATADRSVA
jgi:AraC-like DNA-binding protein